MAPPVRTGIFLGGCVCICAPPFADFEAFRTVGGIPLGSPFFLVLASVPPEPIERVDMNDFGRSGTEEPVIWGPFFPPTPIFGIFELTPLSSAPNRGLESSFFLSVACIGTSLFSTVTTGCCEGPGPGRFCTAGIVAAT